MIHVAALISVFLPFPMSAVGFWQAYDILTDLSLFLVALSAYTAIRFRNLPNKVVTAITAIVCGYSILHNLMVDYDIMTSMYVNLSSFLTALLASFIFIFLFKWNYDKIDSEDIEVGRFYHVYSRPKSNIQMLGFFLTLGRYGGHLVTNGIHIWKFSLESKRLERRPFKESDIANRKVVLIDKDISKKLAKKEGSRWTLFNNCFFIGR